MVDFFTAMEVSASGLSAQRTRMNVASSNLANAGTTRRADGPGPYRRKDVVLTTAPTATAEGADPVRASGDGPAFEVKVAAIQEDQRPPRMEFDPGHPDADANGYVAYPNVNVVEEMVDMITASRAYEAGVTAIDSAVSMAERALTIGK
jgi:flagellar basal-body rod protein FlgC